MRQLKPDQLSFLAAVFDCLFDAYDRRKDDAVVRICVASGLCLFAKGDKSTKLQAVFAVHDSDGDGLLTRLELERFLESLLLALVAVSLHTSSSSSPAGTPVKTGARGRHGKGIGTGKASVAASLQIMQALVHDYAEWVSREVSE